MSKYIGIQNQIWRNNIWSAILLVAFPILVLVLVYAFFFFMNYDWYDHYNKICNANSNAKICQYDKSWDLINPFLEKVNKEFSEYYIYVVILLGVWFIIAYFFHEDMIKSSVWSVYLDRKNNTELYNLLENLCISQWMKMPKLALIEDNSLNAFASWIDEKTYTITLSRWIVEKLTKDELEAVLAHELWHIKNKDTRLLIISIIFVWIFSFLSWILYRTLRVNNNKKANQIIFISFILSIIWYFFSILIRFALSRKREFLADAFSAQATKKPRALASALRKIALDPLIEDIKRKDLAQAFIENPNIQTDLVFNFWW